MIQNLGITDQHLHKLGNLANYQEKLASGELDKMFKKAKV